MPKPPLQTHRFNSDHVLIHPLRPETGCTECTQLEGHPVHAVPDTSEAQAAARARVGDVDA